MTPSEEFKDTLSQNINAKSTAGKLALFDGLLDKLMDLLIGLFDQCIGQLTPAQVAARMVRAKPLDRQRFANNVRGSLYGGSSKEFKSKGGAEVAASVWETTAKLGKDKCEAVVTELTEGENWWPNSDLFMG